MSLISGAAFGTAVAAVGLIILELIGGVLLGDRWRQHSNGCLLFYGTVVIVGMAIGLVAGVMAVAG